MKTAKFVKKITGWRGDARLYKLSEPIGYDNTWDIDVCKEKTDYVIVSSVYATFTGTETYIFPATADGDAINMSELKGSYRGGYDHELALERAGYTVILE